MLDGPLRNNPALQPIHPRPFAVVRRLQTRSDCEALAISSRFKNTGIPLFRRLKVLSRELEPLGVTSGNDRHRRQGLFLGNRFNRINPSSDVLIHT
jgi:hypothetical protein